MTDPITIPADRMEAIAELDVARWGEAEREASLRIRLRDLPTYGLALNSLARLS